MIDDSPDRRRHWDRDHMQHTNPGFPIRLATVSRVATERLTPTARGAQNPAQQRMELRVLGTFAVLRDGAPVALPPSRKTRALLAYLAIDGRRHQRERLCELFWELPDDPRGALRWSLSRIRQVLGDDEHILKADRNTVQLSLDNVGFGYTGIRGLTQLDLNACPLSLLESCAAQFAGPFLADLSLPRCPEFEAWRAAISDEADVLHIRLLRALIERTGAEPERALGYAHQLRRLSPDNQNLAREIEVLSRAARQSAMEAQPAARTLRVAGARPVEWRDRAADTGSRVLPLHRPGLRPQT
jgi:DNA-binding SARP family transcriptional activator